MSEFVDNPGAPLPGVRQDRWAELSEQERVYISRMYDDITRQDLSPAERQALFRVYENARDEFFRLREMWKG